MLSSWVVNEMKTVNLNDKRLDNRLRRVLSQLAEHPTASIPARVKLASSCSGVDTTSSAAGKAIATGAGGSAGVPPAAGGPARAWMRASQAAIIG